MNRILLIARERTDLGDLLQKCCPDVTVISPEVQTFDAGCFDALCILGGCEDESLLLSPALRECVEEMREQKKPVFTEFVRSIGGSYLNTQLTTTHHRMVFADKELPVEGLSTGDVLDGHNNDCIDYCFKNKSAYPILTYHDYVCAHSHVEMDEETYKKGVWALWFLDPTTLICSFRLCNFRRARLAPRRCFEALITAILSYLAGERVTPLFEAPVCTYVQKEVKCTADVASAVERGLAWYQNAGMLKNGGKDGTFEGFKHHIKAQNGLQVRADDIRTDCTAETAGAFLLHALQTGDAQSRAIADALFAFCFRYMQIKKGEHKGMIRWTETAWECCYQDDVARVLLPLLLQQHFDGTVPYFKEICAGLDYLVETTGPEGVRVSRTDCPRLTPERREELKKPGVGIPCAHHNAYYHAVLLLAYRAGGDKRYFEVAQRGLSHIMSLYPNTLRETSETEENCRLLLALAVLYEITGEQQHYEWLCRVSSYLEAHRHESGAVPEWDTGYQAKCSRNHTGECALLAENGDPVAELLYSNNWLPLGYAYAYLATNEARFVEMWNKTASFMLSCQIHSSDPLLDGAWSRAFDLENWESHGVPHDVGWAPCCIESGWTVAEILMGLQFMSRVEELKK